MKKWVMWSLGSFLAGLLIVAGILYFALPAILPAVIPTAIIVPENHTAIIIPAVNETPVPEIIFIGITTISPSDLATDEGIINNVIITFDEAIDPATMNMDTVRIRGPNNQIITGVISSDETKKIWTFDPVDSLLYNSVYDVRITTGVKGISGNSLAYNFVWSFTTAAESSSGGSSGGGSSSEDLVLTTITLSPVTTSIEVGDTQQMNATSLDQNNDSIVATIIYNSSNETVATVNASGFVTALAVGTTTINASSGAISNTSTITVIAAYDRVASIDLGAATGFAVLSAVSISDTVPTGTIITGDIGVSPVTGTAITGISCPPTAEVIGTIWVEAFGGDTLLCQNVTPLTTNITAIGAAFDDANSRALSGYGAITTALDGLTLVPGVYEAADFDIGNDNDVTLDCQGNSSAVFIFRTAGHLWAGTNTHVQLIGSCQAENVFWAVAGTTQIHGGVGTESTFEGTIIGGPATTQMQIFTGSTINGRLLGQKSIALDQNIITRP